MHVGLVPPAAPDTPRKLEAGSGDDARIWAPRKACGFPQAEPRPVFVQRYVSLAICPGYFVIAEVTMEYLVFLTLSRP